MIKIIKKILLFISRPKENFPNWLILKYHIFKAIRKIKNKKKNILKDDMFNWSLYNLHFRGEMKEALKLHTLKLHKNDYILKNSNLQKNTNVKPLHENWRLIYETILQLQPKSVLELGCGHGMHLNNIQVLAPDIKLSGLDISGEQIKYLRETYPNLKAIIKQHDATTPTDSIEYLKSELTYTQAVIMHIHKDNRHLIALTNLFNLSSQYVILMERWKNHKYMNEIKKLYEENKIKWGNINFYYRQSKKNKNSTIMVCSKVELPYKILTDHKLLPQF